MLSVHLSVLKLNAKPSDFVFVNRFQSLSIGTFCAMILVIWGLIVLIGDFSGGGCSLLMICVFAIYNIHIFIDIICADGQTLGGIRNIATI